MAEETSLLQRQLQFLKQKLDPAIQGIGEQFSYDNVFPQGIMGALVGPGSLNAANDYEGNAASDYLNNLNLKTENYMSSDPDTQGEQILKELVERFRGIGEKGLNILEYPGRKVEEGIEFIQSPSDVRLAEAAKEDEIENQRRLAIEELGSFTVDQELLDNADELSDFGFLDVTQFDVEQEEKRKAAAEKFRLQEEELVNSQGGLGSMTVAESDKIKKESIELTQKDAEEGFMAAMDDFFEGARGTGPEMPKKRTIEQYKEAFSEATGIDVSGKVDKKAFLMSIGLGLLQNKAGKNFDISKMAEETGRVIEEALPALEKAKESARQGALAGGKFALQTESADKAVRAAAEEKMLNRDRYWVFKKGTTDKPFEGFNTGQFESLNKYELDKLMKDPKFQEQFEFVSSNDRMDILAKREAARIAASDALADKWEKSETVSLIGGKWENAPTAFQVTSSNIKSNYTGDRSVLKLLGQDADLIIKEFQGYQRDIYKDEKKFDELIGNINSSGISIPGQFMAGVNDLFISLGISGKDTSTVQKANQALSNFAIDEATTILQEAGKTLSDTDRQLVKDRVGQINWTLAGSNPEQLKKQIAYVYDLVVTKAQKNLDLAVRNLDKNYGITVGPSNSSNSKQSPITKAELNEYNTMYGTDFTMETFPKD